MAKAMTVLDEVAKLAHEERRTLSRFRAFGKIVLAQRKARMGRNPPSGQAGQEGRQIPGSQGCEGRHPQEESKLTDP
jgi:hypothetical protein